MHIRADYKRAATATQRRRKTARRHGLLVMTLILIGLFGGLLAYIRKSPEPATPPEKANVSTSPPASQTSPAAPAQATSTPPHKKTSSAAQNVEWTPVKPRYEFYTELPKRQIEVNVQPAPAAPARPQPTAKPKPTARATPVVAAVQTAQPPIRLHAALVKTALSTSLESRTKIAIRTP